MILLFRIHIDVYIYICICFHKEEQAVVAGRGFAINLR